MDIQILLSMRKLSTIQSGQWIWGRESTNPFAWVTVMINGKEEGKISIDDKARVSSIYNRPVCINIDDFNLKLEIYDIKPHVYKRDVGAFGMNTKGTLESVRVRVLLKKTN